ncbi:tRNA (cytidine(34)-2'-O)-methyltransferase [Chitiniphilus shinanonensis]|uniref:tRNA (cytidine(34)-2'-O)-methyltransferase n=1 Tax=Chitiniphilus shinanonensis TaxID=553088 RepID=A0ABQ6BMC9_9NEIS|nr:tRNA (cytidine(34)-2'-O)-methyltransferase [Chitiniphilus shinanonensis]GLS03165.1 tRNA (cytidine(34)-2'-O)-methyltransferase [Chitiniphilus shinanonensis]
MFHIVLFQPEIPPNTGNVIRLAANTGCALHLVKPLGFELDDARLRRAGLDYHEYATLQVHEDWDAARAVLGERRCFAMTTRSSARVDSVAFADEDVFVFGPETRGLPQDMLDRFAPEARIRLPMRPGQRSLNLSNAVAVTVFEAWRQLGYPGSV